MGNEHSAAFSMGAQVAEGVEVLCDEHHLHHFPAADVVHVVVEVLHGLPQAVDDRLQPAASPCTSTSSHKHKKKSKWGTTSYPPAGRSPSVVRRVLHR
jgi:hypothetical protein